MVRRLLSFSMAMLLIAATQVYSQSAAAPPDSNLALAMDQVVAAVYKPDKPGAAVLVVKDGKAVFRRGYGLADVEQNLPIKPEMVFRLCSVTKQFTAMAIMMLVDQGKLSPDDDLTKFFPGYPTGGKKLTVENLLTHTSGIKDYLEKMWPARMRQDLRAEKLLDVFKNDPLEFEPGTRYSYSNSNYALLGLIIEKLSGKEYGEFIEDNIFKPLGMTHSCFERVQAIVPNRVLGYVRGDGGVLYDAPYLSMTQLYAAGGLCSSVDDLALWDAAMYTGKLLKPASMARMFKPYKLASGESTDYGYGWGVSQFQGRTIESHAGGIPGFRAYVLRLPDDHVYVTVLSNNPATEVQPEYVARRLAALAIGKPIAEPKMIKLDPTILDAYVGTYQENGGDKLTFRRDGARLFAQGGMDPEFELYAISEDSFIVTAFDARVSFTKDAAGKVTGLVIHAGDQQGAFKKIK